MVGWGISFREKHMQEFLYRMLYNKKGAAAENSVDDSFVICANYIR